MASISVLKLVLDDKEYEANVKSAKRAMQDLEQSLHDAGKTFEQVDEKVVEYARAIGNMETTSKSGMQGMRELTRTATDLTLQYRQLTDAEKNSPFGTALKGSIDQLIQRAGVMKDAMADVQLEVAGLASDTQTFNQLTGAATIATSAFQTFQGGAKLLGIELGNDVQVIAKLQAAMAVTNGLTQIQNLLQKESALMMGVTALQAKAAAVAQSLLAKNTVAATVAQRAFNVAAKANPYALLATAAIAAVSAIVAFSGEEKKATEEEERLAAAIRKHIDETAKISKSSGDMLANFETLRVGWGRLRTEAEKNSFIKENASLFDSLGLSVKTVTDAQKVLVAQAPQVIEALRSVAEAEAYKDMFQESIRKREQFANSNELRGFNPLPRRALNTQYNHIPTEWSQAALSAGDYIISSNELGTAMRTTYQLTVQGLDKINQYRNQKASEARRQRAQELDDEVNAYADKWTQAANRAYSAQSRLGLTTTTTTPPTPPRPTNTNQPTQETSVTYPEGSLPYLTQQLQDLQKAQALALNPDQWQEYQRQIEETQRQIDVFKGKIQDIDRSAFNQANVDATVGKFVEDTATALANADFGSELYDQLTARLADASAFTNALQAMVKNGIAMADFPEMQELWNKVIAGINIDDAAWQELVTKINEKLRELDPEGIQIKIDIKDGTIENIQNAAKAAEKSWRNTAKAIQSVGSAIQSIEDPAAKVAGIVAQAIANIALAFSKSSIEAAGGGPVAWIAATTTGLATMISTIEAIKNATHYARGGIVPGNDYTDSTPVMVSSGELILSRSQQANLATHLSDNNGGSYSAQPYVEAEKIVLGVNNYFNRRGMGEIITSNRR